MYFWRPQLVHFERGHALTMFDWVIQDGRRPPPGTRDPNAANVASGVFDTSWRRQDRWTALRDENAELWTLRRAPAKGFAASPRALQAAAGRYELGPGAVVTIRVDGDHLIVDLPPQWSQPPLKMKPESDAVYLPHQRHSGVRERCLRGDQRSIRGKQQLGHLGQTAPLISMPRIEA